MDIITKIRRRQALTALPHPELPEHHPEMLYLGCVDARLDPIDDIGIEKGLAMIHRNVGAIVTEVVNGKPRDTSLAATVDFAVNGRKVKHIVVSAHTDCGGLKACQHGVTGEEFASLAHYLERLDKVRAKVMEQAKQQGWSDARILQELEKESVRQSISNLLEFPTVKKAIAEGRVQVHGWVLDTATASIHVMDPTSKEFSPMVEKSQENGKKR